MSLVSKARKVVDEHVRQMFEKKIRAMYSEPYTHESHLFDNFFKEDKAFHAYRLSRLLDEEDYLELSSILSKMSDKDIDFITTIIFDFCVRVDPFQTNKYFNTYFNNELARFKLSAEYARLVKMSMNDIISEKLPMLLSPLGLRITYSDVKEIAKILIDRNEVMK